MNSMTGFGRAVAQTDRYNIPVEISGVNRKQTEIAVNVPRNCAEWDAPVRSIVQGSVSAARGRFRLPGTDGGSGRLPQVDERKLASLVGLLNRASDLAARPMTLQASDLLRLDIIASEAEAALSPEEAWPAVEEALRAALKDFLAMRAAEGANLKADVLGKLETLEKYRNRIAEHAPSVPSGCGKPCSSAWRKRTFPSPRMTSASSGKWALFADKCDISEEITRLSSHFDQFRTLCDSSTPAGRPLDFLCRRRFSGN